MKHTVCTLVPALMQKKGKVVWQNRFLFRLEEQRSISSLQKNEERKKSSRMFERFQLDRKAVRTESAT
jgi:hypothetical protein